MYINGCVPYRTKKEKKQIFKELKQEFGNDIKIRFLDNHFISYSCVVNRQYYL
jgi:hypothetical protein